MKIEHFGYIENGKLHIMRRKQFDAEIKGAKNMDVSIIIKKRGKRSSQANRYYWGVLIDEIRREFLRRGDHYTPEEIHEGLKAKFNPKTTGDKKSGEVIFITGETTTEMNKQEFGEYIDRIIQWAARSLEITIPSPGEQVKMFE